MMSQLNGILICKPISTRGSHTVMLHVQMCIWFRGYKHLELSLPETHVIQPVVQKNEGCIIESEVCFLHLQSRNHLYHGQ